MSSDDRRQGSDSEWANSLWPNRGSLQTTDFVLHHFASEIAASYHQTLKASCVPTAKVPITVPSLPRSLVTVLPNVRSVVLRPQMPVSW
jgi:hypothetical protein